MSSFTNSTLTSGWWHDKPVASDWFNYVVKTATSDQAVDPRLAPPDAAFMVHTTERILKRLFAVAIGLNPQWLVPDQASMRGNMTVVKREERMFFAPYVYEVLLALLATNLAVAILTLIKRPGRFLPRMPTSIASVLALGIGSSLLDYVSRDDLCQNSHAYGSGERHGSSFRYGKYVDTRGQLRVGIEQQPFCQPLAYRNGWQRIIDRITRSRVGVIKTRV